MFQQPYFMMVAKRKGGFESNFKIFSGPFIDGTIPFLIEQPFVSNQGYNIEIGDNFYCNHNAVMLDAAKITYGDYVFIAPNCGFYTAGHALDVE